MQKHLTVIPYKLREVFLRGIEEYKIVYLRAGAGWGKTTVIQKLLGRRTAHHVSLLDHPLPRCFSRERLIVLDDFQELPRRAQEQFRDVLRKSPQSQHFILLSRATLPEYLSFYEARDLLFELGESDLALDMSCLARLAEAHQVSLLPGELQRLREVTGGHPVAVKFLLLGLSSGRPFHKQTIDEAFIRVGAYMDEAVFRRLDVKSRALLLKVSFFGQFDLPLAETLTGDKKVCRTLEQLRQTTGLMKCYGGTWSLTDAPFWIPYLKRKATTEYSPETVRAIHLAGGRWYTGKHDFKKGLAHYQQAESRESIIQTLSENARLHPGGGTYYEMRDYYGLLTREEIRSSPEMICAMSMLCSMTLDVGGAEAWYDTLNEYAQGMGRGDSDGQAVRGMLAYLDLALPHRGSTRLSELIPAVFAQAAGKEIILPEISVSGNLPSLLRGGKDFSKWVSQEKLLYHSICAPAQAALGRFGVGLGDIALTEIQLERGEDISAQFPALMSVQKEIRTCGTPEMEFVLVALLVRALYAAGALPRALEMLLDFRGEAEKSGAVWLLPNIDAMRCRLSLMKDDGLSTAWFAGQAPGEQEFHCMEVYRYMTKVRCYLKRMEYHSALLLLGRLLDLAQEYDRQLDLLEALILTAVCRFRMGGEDWRSYFTQALELGGKFGYVSVFTREGAALLPLMERYDHSGVQPDYWKRILAGTVTQAGCYGQYLKPMVSPAAHLTPTETMILQLICENKNNKEICALLEIKMPTVKTHLRNLFKKLGVPSRVEAQLAARRLQLL